MDELVGPLQDKLEDWKRNTVQIDKDHAKGTLIHPKSSFPEKQNTSTKATVQYAHAAPVTSTLILTGDLLIVCRNKWHYRFH